MPALRCTATNGQSETTISLLPAISDTRPASVLASVTVFEREAMFAVERMAAHDVRHPLDGAELQDTEAHFGRRSSGARRSETHVRGCGDDQRPPRRGGYSARVVLCQTASLPNAICRAWRGEMQEPPVGGALTMSGSGPDQRKPAGRRCPAVTPGPLLVGSFGEPGSSSELLRLHTHFPMRSICFKPGIDRAPTDVRGGNGHEVARFPAGWRSGAGGCGR